MELGEQLAAALELLRTLASCSRAARAQFVVLHASTANRKGRGPVSAPVTHIHGKTGSPRTLSTSVGKRVDTAGLLEQKQGKPRVTRSSRRVRKRVPAVSFAKSCFHASNASFRF